MSFEAPTADLMDVKAFAAYIGKSDAAARQMIYRGDAPPFAKIGGRQMTTKQRVDAWLQEQFEAASA